MRLNSRLRNLESKAGPKPGELTYTARAVIGSDSTITCEDGVHRVNVSGGSSFSREDFETDEAFCNAVEAEHQRVHGIPMEQGKGIVRRTIYEKKPCV
ncbi:hypothetical protein ACFFUT_05600 [Pseudohalocynthiibacter aestuariivivens]|uniref:Uncharacterized protein n=1 Tax=Pseudohalocynthiibacter aestuariivivens TaxID=1591409 RepID=A0ABV5JEW1_9RHOB|nr:hypothetical protein [Pseudohalocynthiibacter aestuariivivens]MBS9717252.1 hypothetical protein [Pseudohalocynthiibacter aestuariivivens]